MHLCCLFVCVTLLFVTVSACLTVVLIMNQQQLTHRLHCHQYRCGKFLWMFSSPPLNCCTTPFFKFLNGKSSVMETYFIINRIMTFECIFYESYLIYFIAEQLPAFTCSWQSNTTYDPWGSTSVPGWRDETQLPSRHKASSYKKR